MPIITVFPFGNTWIKSMTRICLTEFNMNIQVVQTIQGASYFPYERSLRHVVCCIKIKKKYLKTSVSKNRFPLYPRKEAEADLNCVTLYSRIKVLIHTLGIKVLK